MLLVLVGLFLVGSFRDKRNERARSTPGFGSRGPAARALAEDFSFALETGVAGLIVLLILTTR